MDPEDLREVISAYQKCVAETVQHFGGFVAKYMGDGVLVYFESQWNNVAGIARLIGGVRQSLKLCMVCNAADLGLSN